MEKMQDRRAILIIKQNNILTISCVLDILQIVW